MDQVDQIMEIRPNESSLESALRDLNEEENTLTVIARNGKLPGVNITGYVLHDIREPVFQKKAEPYLIGLAMDSTLKPFVIPPEIADPRMDPSRFQLEKLEVGKTYTFGDDSGSPLVVPPVKDFLALVLLVCDSDSASATVAILKSAGEFASNTVVQAAAAGLNPTAGVALAVLGPALNAAQAAVKSNRDDVIAKFSTSYFTAKTLKPGRTHKLEKPGATVYLKVGERPETD